MQFEFIESSIFAKMVHDYLSDEDYAAFQHFCWSIQMLAM